MPLLVDGDNLLGTWPGRSRSDLERRRLLTWLDRQRRRQRVVVVFDGPEPPGGALGPDVHFSGPGRSADELILGLLRREIDRRGWTVVTSDRSLGDRCRHLDARVERSHLFRKRALGEGGPEKPEREADVDYWLKEFEG